MRSVIRSDRWKHYATAVGVLLLVIGGVFITRSIVGDASVAHAITQGVTISHSGGCANTYDICTDNGFGWTLYQTDGSTGRPDFFSAGPYSWASISSACSYAGGAYIFEVGGKAKPGNAGPYTEAYAMSIIWYGAYYPGGSYWNTHYAGDDYNTVHSIYLDNLGGSENDWDGGGHSLEWFCYNENPAWNISVTSTANEAVAEAGETITWTHTITNDGPDNNKTNKNVAWGYQNSGGLPTGSGSFPAYPTGSAKGTTSTQTTTYQVKVSDFGKKLCQGVTATPSTNNGGTISSTPYCVLVAKKPKVQVLGGDLQTGLAFSGSTAPSSSNITTSTSNIAGAVYGSWGQYGVLASGVISGFASGAAYHVTGGLTCTLNCAVNSLSLTNQVPTSIGSYKSTTSTIPDIGAAFPTSSSTPTYTSGSDLATEAAKKQIETTTSGANITIGGGTIGKGNWLVINAPTATVTITGDINYYAGSLDAINDIPQVVIIANNINIAGGVKNVDAWLVASGTNGVINTCSDVVAGGALSGAVCNNALTVHGPVMAKKIYLQRTAGGDAPNNIADPGETFDLRPDAYLWASARGIDQLHLYNAATTELPPRF